MAMRFLRTVLVVAVGLGSTACFQSNTLVKLKADGSGTIEQRIVFTAAAVQQMKQLGGGANTANFDPLSDDVVRDLATGFGTGVRLVSSTPVKNATGEGRDIVFAFDDIAVLRVSQQPPGASALGGTGDALAFTLTRRGGTVLLHIGMPGVSNLTGAVGGPGGAAPAPAQLGMLKMLLAGARVSIAVEPTGRLVRTSSPYVEGNRVTLLDLPIDALFADPTLLTRLSTAPDAASAQALLAGVPGLKVPAEPEITIEFAP